MSTVNPAASNPLPPVDPSLIVVAQGGHGGGKHKTETHTTTTNQPTVVQQPSAALQPGQLEEIHQLMPEETHPEKNKEEKDRESDPKKEKQPSPRTQWRRMRISRLKV